MAVIKRNALYLVCFFLVFGFMILFKHEEHLSPEEAFAIEVIQSQLKNEDQEHVDQQLDISRQEGSGEIPKEGAKEKVNVDQLPDTHTVAPGDTLSVISRKYGIAINKLKEINHLTSDTIYVGQVLYLKENVAVSPTP